MTKHNYFKKITAASLRASSEQKLKEDEVNYSKNQLNVVSPKSALHFGDVTIRFFEVSHNIPESSCSSQHSD